LQKYKSAQCQTHHFCTSSLTLSCAQADATAAEKALIIGGETTMWGECVDAVNFDGVVWPRAAAAAEQLWSPQAKTANASKDVPVANRLAEHRCRLVGRGVAAAPLDSSDLHTVDPGCQ
jgi:N-acetyl-beta-hexosaminidase